MKDIVQHLIKNNKAQALVEFVLLLPVLLFILFIIFDFANIFYHKNHLEGIINDVAVLVENKASDKKIKETINNKSITYTIEPNEEFAKIKLTEKVSLVTPFSNIVFDNPYIIYTERTVSYE